MAHILRDSFDFYAGIADSIGLWSGGINNGFLSATTRFSTGQSWQIPNVLNQTALIHSWATNSTTVFLTFSHRQTPALSGNDAYTFRIYDGATVQCSIRFIADGSIRFSRGNDTTTLGTYSGAFAGNGTWNHFQIKIILSDTVGEFHVRKNGNTADDYSLTAVDNVSSAAAQANGIDQITRQSAGSVMLFDDFWLFDSTVVSGEPSDWIGDVRAVQIMPNSDSAVQFTRSAGSTNYENVDELIKSETDYVYSQTVGHVDLYGNAGFTTAPASIVGLAIRSIGKKMDAGTRTVGLQINSGGTVVNSSAVAIGTTTQSVVFNKDLDPNTSGVWTPTSIAALLFGPRIVT